jgi:alkaline phosphatase
MRRRDFIKKIGAGVVGVTLLPGCVQTVSVLPMAKNDSGQSLRFGLITDPHYADKDPLGSRVYRDSDDKAIDFINLCNTQEVDFVIETGDLKDQGPDAASTLSYLQAIEAEMQKFNGPTYHVLGNHDTDNISKAQFLANVTNTDIPSTSKYYSFDAKGVHCVVLDANYKSDGTDYDSGNFDWTDTNIPQAQIDWLTTDLASASGPVIVFVHQLLDGEGSVYIDNAPAVRTVLETSGKVVAVFQGHHHPGSYSLINGIHYYTLKAMVESALPANAYAVVEVLSDEIVVTGYVNAVSKNMLLRPGVDEAHAV